MTGVIQSLSGDGATPMSALKKIGQLVDLRRRIKFATWNVMTLSGTGYQVVLVHELARFNLSSAGTIIPVCRQMSLTMKQHQPQ